MAASNEAPTIIIKKKKKGGHHGHHGGAWKVAYADFVTAMMAFFLLLWLLNVTTDEQRGGIADYFNPASVARPASGAGGVLGGTTVASPGPMSSPSSPVSIHSSLPGRPEAVEDSYIHDDGYRTQEPDAEAGGELHRETDMEYFASTRRPSEEELEFLKNSRDLTADEMDFLLRSSDFTEEQITFLKGAHDVSDAELDAALAEREEAQFQAAKEKLRQAIQSVPELSALADSLIIDETPEGLRIQIVDQERVSMFPIGSAQMYDRTRELIGLVAQVISEVPKDISIAGHTDSTPFVGGAHYDNWELSTDRANASRRALIDAGLDPSRIANVVGKADTDHLFPDNPASPRNRRISIVLLRESLAPAATAE